MEYTKGQNSKALESTKHLTNSQLITICLSVYIQGPKCGGHYKCSIIGMHYLSSFRKCHENKKLLGDIFHHFKICGHNGNWETPVGQKEHSVPSP